MGTLSLISRVRKTPWEPRNHDGLPGIRRTRLVHEGARLGGLQECHEAAPERLLNPRPRACRQPGLPSSLRTRCRHDRNGPTSQQGPGNLIGTNSQDPAPYQQDAGSCLVVKSDDKHHPIFRPHEPHSRWQHGMPCHRAASPWCESPGAVAALTRPMGRGDLPSSMQRPRRHPIEVPSCPHSLPFPSKPCVAEGSCRVSAPAISATRH